MPKDYLKKYEHASLFRQRTPCAGHSEPDIPSRRVALGVDKPHASRKPINKLSVLQAVSVWGVTVFAPQL
jgi:hypothetical protein